MNGNCISANFPPATRALKGSTEIVYSLLDTITEERNYSPKQPMKPPVPHYTDGMPDIEIPAGQIIASDQLPI